MICATIPPLSPLAQQNPRSSYSPTSSRDAGPALDTLQLQNHCSTAILLRCALLRHIIIIMSIYCARNRRGEKIRYVMQTTIYHHHWMGRGLTSHPSRQDPRDERERVPNAVIICILNSFFRCRRPVICHPQRAFLSVALIPSSRSTPTHRHCCCHPATTALLCPCNTDKRKCAPLILFHWLWCGWMDGWSLYSSLIKDAVWNGWCGTGRVLLHSLTQRHGSMDRHRFSQFFSLFASHQHRRKN